MFVYVINGEGESNRPGNTKCVLFIYTFCDALAIFFIIVFFINVLYHYMYKTL